jgi:hypothetical protein
MPDGMKFLTAMFQFQVNFFAKIGALKNIRFEVIDETQRQYVRYGVDLEFHIQDDARTLKIFVKDNNKV